MEMCRIELSRGYVTAQFFARGEGTFDTVCEPSAAFRWRGRTAPDTPEARLAHYEIVARLKGEGWAKTADGDEWYASEFTRSTLVARMHPPSDESDDAVEDVEAPAPRTVFAPPPPPDSAEPPTPEWRSEPRTRLDWSRYVAASGLAAAVALLIWILTHAP